MNKPVYTVDQFCNEHGGLSRAFFYKLVKKGIGPRLMKVGNRTLISYEAATEWREEMERRTSAVAKGE